MDFLNGTAFSLVQIYNETWLKEHKNYIFDTSSLVLEMDSTHHCCYLTE